MMRLQKFLSQAGVCSRRKGEAYITQGLVKVNGEKVTNLGTKVDIEQDEVRFKDNIITFEIEKSKIYIVLNKPKGIVTSCSHKGEKIVLDLVNISDRIYPVGRLDKDSCGLILLTNDGQLHNKLSHPSFNHEKEYIVTTFDPISNGALNKMTNGIVLDGKKTREAKVKKISKYEFKIVLKQGINRQIRRMVKKTGNKVKELKRIRVGNLKLRGLAQGDWRYLSNDETKILQSTL